MIDALYDASAAGCRLTSLCAVFAVCARGAGLSENIRVKSIIGRFLEHSRIVCFGDGHGYLHPMPRFSCHQPIDAAQSRPSVEVLTPILNPTVHAQVLNQIMEINLADNEQSWVMQPDASFARMRARGEAG